jgi:hypothetical protein
MSSATPSLAVQPSIEVDAGSPLFKVIIPYAYAAFSVVVSLFSFLLALIRLVLSPLPILLYIIAPITTFIDVTTTLFIRLPYRTFLYLADALYPLYVLIGVACITGCLFGYGGRLLVGAIVDSIVGPPGRQSKIAEMLRQDMKARGRQHVKFEQ